LVGEIGPAGIAVLGALPADDAQRVCRVGVVLGDLRGAVVIVVVGVADVAATHVLELDLEAVAFLPRIVDGVEIVESAVALARPYYLDMCDG
jgi:hypothetical protein